MRKTMCVIILIVLSFTLSNAYAEKIFDWFSDLGSDKSEFEFELDSDGNSYCLIDYNQSRNSSSEIIIPSTYNDLPVTKIGSRAFYACKKIESIIIPEGIKTIGSTAFFHCENLKCVQFPQSLYSIGESAFEGCDSLEEVYIPDATEIGWEAFYECENLTSVGIGVESEGIVIGASTIDCYAFSKCPNLETVTLGKSVTYIDESAFNSCDNLTTVNLTRNINTIESLAFAYCYNLKTINFDGTNGQWKAIRKISWWDKGANSYEVICSR